MNAWRSVCRHEVGEGKGRASDASEQYDLRSGVTASQLMCEV